MNLPKKSHILVFLFLVVMAGLATAAVKSTKKPVAVKIKPDIALRDLTITPMSVLGDGSHVVQIKAVVYNPVAMSSTGSFVVLAQKGSSASLIDHFLAEENVGSLSNTGATVKAPSEAILFSDTVPFGTTVHYRVKADAHVEVDEANEGNNIKEARYSASPPIGDGGGDEAVHLGVDLVVSRVMVTRGMFGGREKIQIVPTIRNMWHGSTSARIKILFTGTGVSIAEWIEDGIGGDETKVAGAVYIECDEDLVLPLKFNVIVDNNNDIVETNEENNRCGPIDFAAFDTRVERACRITGPHEPLI